MTCKYCAKRAVKNNGVTCGNSYCQEADYHDNAARNTRGKRKKADHRQRQQECEALAAKG
jgi:hypothetical protein